MTENAKAPLRARLKIGLIRLLKLGTVGAVLMVIGTATTVQVTARSEFCNSCHIMEPYYKSWQQSAHSHVPCVDCHYEPGMLETATGKFKAMSQLAKYVTGTQGTKPWAEVSDQSCMRSGCHSERLLSGTLDFGEVRFDHRHHLLETRRGRRLRCTSCHSQIVQGDHMKVTPSACFLCHFRKSGETESHGECNTCHGPPREVIEVGGVSFRHSDYTDRGVECALCHKDVTRGDGLAHKNRCNSCHGEVEHIEHFNDTEFIHEQHITIQKVECNECHDDIQHGLLDRHLGADAGECGSCHKARHGSQWNVYAGRGGTGVPDTPSAMYLTRVDCAGCHRGFWEYTRNATMANGVGPSSEASCMHCHGHAFGGMLGMWREEVTTGLTSLEARLKELEGLTLDATTDEDLKSARANLELIRSDGSFGAHNIPYVLDLLRNVRDRLNAAGSKHEPVTPKLNLEIGLPVDSETNCATACHIDAARSDPGFLTFPFRHRPHLETAGLDCGDCHSTEKHGKTTAQPQTCIECHHDSEEPSCQTCHVDQDRLLRGTLEIPGLKLDVERLHKKNLACTDCHTDLEATDQLAVAKKGCIKCHGSGFDSMVDDWIEAANEELTEIATRIKKAQRRLASAKEPLAKKVTELLTQVTACEKAARTGVPAHNISGADSLTTAAMEILDQIEKLLDAAK